jgi:DNA polymerase-3 subunit epsilon
VTELHTRQVGWARSQAESLTEYFISIGRLDPEDALDGTWPVRIQV